MSKLGALHVTKHTGRIHQGTLIIFHGSGGNGDDMKKWVQLMINNFSFPHIKILYPTAPLQPYTPARGSLSNVWFDREGIAPEYPEKHDSLAKIETEVKRLLKFENDCGIASNKIVVGGFSMGGSLALHTAMRWDKNLAGVFVFSSFLSKRSCVYQSLEKSNKVPPLLQLHGDQDEMVDLSWGKQTFSELRRLGVKGDFHTLPGLGHSINRDGMLMIHDWVEKISPYLYHL